MNIWNNTVLTDKGLSLLAKLTQGNSLNITKAVTGGGFVTPGLLAKQTEVANQKQSLSFRPVSYPETGKCAITVSLKNDGISTGYTATQVGLYATDPDEGEVLLIIAQSPSADSGTIIPSETEMPGYSSEWTFYLQYGQADGVTVTVDPANTVSWKEMEEYVATNGVGKRASRLTVGTSTRGWTKRDCDYLCDGEADDVEIQEAIDALVSSKGGEIILLDGEYEITKQINVNGFSVTISGSGRSTELSRRFDDGAVLAVNGAGCTVRNLYIHGRQNPGEGITVSGGSCNIIDNEIDYLIDSAGIRVHSNNNIIRGNRVTQTGGIVVGGFYNTITGNMSVYNTNAFFVYGIGNILTKNIARTSVYANISLDAADNCIVTDNIATVRDDDNVKPKYGAIIVADCDNTIIENNHTGMESDPIQVTLSSSGWVGTEAPYTYTIAGYNGRTVEVVEDVSMTMEQLEAIENAKIKSDPRSEDNILYAFGEKPAIDVPVLLIVR